MTTPTFEAIIFDHDGTLIDTEKPDYEACHLLCQEVGYSLTLQQWAEQIVGRMDGYELLFDQMVRANHNGLTKAFLQQRLNELWQITFKNVELMPGASQLLNQLHAAGYPLAVATASDRAWVSRWLSRFDLQSYFQVVACRDDIVHNKPAPDVYLFAAARLGIRPDRCLVFEDSVAGTQAAKAAGMTVVAVPSHLTRVLDFSQADGTIDGLDKVNLAWIEAFGQRLAR